MNVPLIPTILFRFAGGGHFCFNCYAFLRKLNNTLSVVFTLCGVFVIMHRSKPCVPPISPLHLSDVTTQSRAEAISLGLPDCRPCNVPGQFTSSRQALHVLLLNDLGQCNL